MWNFKQIIGKLNEDYAAAVQKGTGEAYSRLSTIFEELNIYCREYLQGLTEDDMEKVIRKLKNGDPISADDIEQIRLWIVGDAEYYVKLKNNFGDWQAELKRLIGEINRFQVDSPDVVVASKLRALFRDGARVLADMFYFVQQKDRLNRFTESTRQIDQSERMILVRLLEQKMASPDF